MESAAKVPLTAWGRFRFYTGGFFCLLGGISTDPGGAFRGDIGFLGAAIFIAVTAFGIAYTAKGRKKVRDWNAVSSWFFWTSLILASLGSYGNVGGK